MSDTGNVITRSDKLKLSLLKAFKIKKMEDTVAAKYVWKVKCEDRTMSFIDITTKFYTKTNRCIMRV